MQHNNDDNDKYNNVIGIYEGGVGESPLAVGFSPVGYSPLG